MRFMFAAPVGAVLLAACASTPSTRDGAGRTDSQLEAARNACSGKSAGEECRLCPPNDGSCFETMELKVCNAAGECGSHSAPVPPPPKYAPCAGKKTGDTCSLCAPGDASCVETMELKACDASGACTSQTSPPAYDPCAGKSSGAACTLCDPADSTCVETAVLKACDAAGVCR
jgi:hypothetical protein